MLVLMPLSIASSRLDNTAQHTYKLNTAQYGYATIESISDTCYMLCFVILRTINNCGLPRSTGKVWSSWASDFLTFKLFSPSLPSKSKCETHMPLFTWWILRDNFLGTLRESKYMHLVQSSSLALFEPRKSLFAIHHYACTSCWQNPSHKQ